MKYKVVIGNVRHNEIIVEEGNFIELKDRYAKPLLASGVIEAVKKVTAPKAKVEVVKTKVDEVKPKEVKVEVKAEPSEDWTRSELDAHALSVGIKNPEKVGSKPKLLKLILKK